MSAWVWRCYLSAYLRRLWYRGSTQACTCPGCPEIIPRWWANGMCRDCSCEDCEHDSEDTQRQRDEWMQYERDTR